MFNPLVLLGGTPEARQALKDYIQAFSDLLHVYRSHEGNLHNHDSAATKYVASKLLQLDIICIKTPTEWKALLSPLHPIHLWRYQEILKTVYENSYALRESECIELSKVLPDLPHLLHYVIFTPEGTNEVVILPQAGALGFLPLFENKTNRYLGLDGISYLTDLLSRWINFAPYSQKQVRLALVDVPDMPEALRSAAEFLLSKKNTNLIIYAYFLNVVNPNSQLALLDYNDEDCSLAELMRSGRLIVHIKKYKTAQEIVDAMSTWPVHIAYIFDQSIYRIDYAPRARNLVVSPLVVTYEYEFSETFHRGTIVPSSDAESGIFSDYSFLVERSSLLPAGQQIRLKYGDDTTHDPYNTILKKKGAKWLSFADRILTSYAPEEAIPLGERREGHREIAVWASATSKAIEGFIDLLKKYNLRPSVNTIRSLLNRFGHIAAGGLLSIPAGGSVISRDSREKALLGTVLASSWYSNRYPNCLIASLDSRLARQWLQDRSDTSERADLIALRMDEHGSELTIDVIEVKTRSNDCEAHVKITPDGTKKLVGHAIKQLDNVINTLTPIFGGSDTQPIFTKARREVLKYQLHRECFRELHDPIWQSKWYAILKQTFSLSDAPFKINLVGTVVHIHLEDNGGEEIIKDESQSFVLAKLGARAIQSLVVDNTTDDAEPLEESTAYSKTKASHTIKSIAVITTSDDKKPTTPKRNEPTELTIPVSHDDNVEMLSRHFIRACQSYRVNLEECDPRKAIIGPTVVRFYIRLSPGQKLADLKNNLEDIGREMGRSGLLVNLIHPNVVVDIPRTTRQVTSLLSVLDDIPEVSSVEQLPIPIGITPEGTHIIRDLGIMPHLLVGGTTGAGKTIFLYGVLTSLLKTHAFSKELQLILSTSKPEDFTFFEGIPHLEQGKIFIDAYEAVQLLQTYVNQSLNERGEILQAARCRDITEYNSKSATKLAPLVVVVDEFADLADQLAGNRPAREAFYAAIRRIAQLGRSKGIHLILCTQRPSADLVPTNIRNLMNARVSLHVNDGTASRMILEEIGAEQLQLKGDLLFKENGNITRAQGYYVSSTELDAILTKIRTHGISS